MRKSEKPKFQKQSRDNYVIISSGINTKMI